MIEENVTAVYSSCLSDGTWSSVSLTCIFDPNASQLFIRDNLSPDWNNGLTMSISTIVTIAILSILIVLSFIIIIVIISHRMKASEQNQRKISQSSSDKLIYNTALDEDFQVDFYSNQIFQLKI